MNSENLRLEWGSFNIRKMEITSELLLIILTRMFIRTKIYLHSKSVVCTSVLLIWLDIGVDGTMKFQLKRVKIYFNDKLHHK